MATGFKIIQNSVPVDIEPYLVRKDLFTADQVYSFGQNNFGQIGNNSTTAQGGLTLHGLTEVRSVSGGANFSMFVKENGTLWVCGYNTQGQLGLNDRTHRSSPVQVGALSNWKLTACDGNGAVAVKTDGSLWSWGNGVLGYNGSSPVQVGSLTNWSDANASNNNYVLKKTDGTVWVSGALAVTHLGLPAGSISSPVQFTTSQWKSAKSGNNGFLGIKTDGTLWAAGNNTEGQLGLGNTTATSSPVQVGSDTTWADVTMSNTGRAHAIKNNGTLWSWGNNGFAVYGGGLGLSDPPSVKVSSPTQVGSLTNWKKIHQTGAPEYFSAFIKTDGTLWACGYNGFSTSFFPGAVDKVSSPVQIGSLSNWKSAEGGPLFLFGIRSV